MNRYIRLVLTQSVVRSFYVFTNRFFGRKRKNGHGRQHCEYYNVFSQ